MIDDGAMAIDRRGCTNKEAVAGLGGGGGLRGIIVIARQIDAV
jgi:hypothetical protein